jgi:hypothetical protein
MIDNPYLPKRARLVNLHHALCVTPQMICVIAPQMIYVIAPQMIHVIPRTA